MVWLRSSLWEEMSSSSYLVVWSWLMTCTVIVFAYVKHPLWLLVDYEIVVVLTTEVIWVLSTISLTNWWNIAIWRLWANTSSSIVFSSLCTNAVILSVICSWFVSFVSHHHLIVVNIVILLLWNLEVLSCICSKLFSTWYTSNRSTNWIALIFTGPLTVITFFFNHKLSLLSTTRNLLLLHLHLNSMSMVLVIGVVELTQLLFWLVWR